LFTHLLFRKDDVLILDMYAGVEHLGRATVDFVNAMIIVVEPTKRSLNTAHQIKSLANDIGLDRLFLVGNKVKDEQEVKFLQTESSGFVLLGFIPDNYGVIEADRVGKSVYDSVPQMRTAAENIAARLSKEVSEYRPSN